MDDEEKIKETTHSLKSMLQWSDRIGSDEIMEIKRLIDLLED